MKVHLDSQKVKKIMFLKGCSMSDMAEIIGISNTYFSQIMNHRKKPSTKLAKNISDVLDVDIEDIFIIEDEEVENHA